MEGRPGQILRGKLKLLCGKLRRWNEETFKVVEEKNKQLLEEIDWWDKKETEHGLSREEPLLKDKARAAEFNKVALIEELKWKQKAKSHWLK